MGIDGLAVLLEREIIDAGAPKVDAAAQCRRLDRNARGRRDDRLAARRSRLSGGARRARRCRGGGCARRRSGWGAARSRLLRLFLLLLERRLALLPFDLRLG